MQCCWCFISSDRWYRLTYAPSEYAWLRWINIGKIHRIFIEFCVELWHIKIEIQCPQDVNANIFHGFHLCIPFILSILNRFFNKVTEIFPDLLNIGESHLNLKCKLLNEVYCLCNMSCLYSSSTSYTSVFHNISNFHFIICKYNIILRYYNINRPNICHKHFEISAEMSCPECLNILLDLMRMGVKL